MKRKQFISIFIALAVCAGSAIAMTGCTSRVYTADGTVVNTTSTAPSANTTDESSEDESSEDESSEEESSEESIEESSEEESSEDESSEEENSDEESSEEESSEEESSEQESSDEESSEEELPENGYKITFTKPEKWESGVLVNVYEKGGSPGEAVEMTDNGDGTYSYTGEYPEADKEYVVTFHSADNPRRLVIPKSGACNLENGRAYSDSDSNEM